MAIAWSSFGVMRLLTLISQEKQVDLLPKLKEKITTPEGVPRLFDLVRVQEERMKLAFYVALRNTVVAHDLDQVYFSLCDDLLDIGASNFILHTLIWNLSISNHVCLTLHKCHPQMLGNTNCIWREP